jgi:hypothetical protein
MNSEEFVEAIKRYVRDAAIEGTMACERKTPITSIASLSQQSMKRCSGYLLCSMAHGPLTTKAGGSN